jgi:hypothetical protein
MRIDDLKTWLLGAGNLSASISALSTGPIPLTAFVDATIILRDWQEPTQEKILFLDPQPDERQFLTTAQSEIIETIEAYVIVTRGATKAVMADQARNYLQALFNCLKSHPDFSEMSAREYYSGYEGKDDMKGARGTLVFRYEE